jgi:hypothetical protein
MRDAVRTVAVLRSALSTRRDVLLEIRALHPQLGVLGRSDRGFRPSIMGVFATVVASVAGSSRVRVT